MIKKIAASNDAVTVEELIKDEKKKTQQKHSKDKNNLLKNKIVENKKEAVASISVSEKQEEKISETKK